MGLMSKAMKVGVVAKAVDVARKPENQQKAKDMLAKAQSKAKERKRR